MTDQAPVLTGRPYVAPLSTQPGDDGWIDAGTLTGWHTWQQHISPVTDAIGATVGTLDVTYLDGTLTSARTSAPLTATITFRLDRRVARILYGIPPGVRWQPRRTTRAQRRRRHT